jgi:hypothetical protein
MQALLRQNRDTRIDFFRGLALWCLFIDHLLKGSLRAITLRQFGFCDGAELFVLLSGISAGMLYRKTAVRDGVMAARLKILRRVAVLYRTHLIMFILYLATAGLLIARLNPPSFLEMNNLDGFDVHPLQNLLNSILLRYQPQYLDILPLYIVLLSTLCLALPLLLRWPRALLGASVLFYAATRAFHLILPGWAGVWYFNPFAWQVIFVTGLTCEAILSGKRYGRGWDYCAGLFALFSLVESHAHHLVHRVPAFLLIHFEVDKSNLHPLKLLSILSLAWLAWRHLPATASWLRSRWTAPFVLLGQHSLPVFASSVLFSLAGEAWFYTHTGWVSQVVVQGVGSLALVAVAAWSVWNTRQTPAASKAKVSPESRPCGTGACGKDRLVTVTNTVPQLVEI